MGMIGKVLFDLDTPALWVDMDGMERNIQHFARYFKSVGIDWRPHTKGIKIPAIAQMLIQAGAIGVTCAKLSEAEVLVEGGIQDILIANQVVGIEKISRLVDINRRADVMVAVDSIENANQISAKAQDSGINIPILVEVDTGMERCGVEAGEIAVRFAQKVAGLPGIQFKGVMGWEGHIVKLEDPEEKKIAVEQSVGLLTHTALLCRQAGLPVSIVSCGGTGSYLYSSHINGVTEMQAGGGIFGDVTYKHWGAEVECSLFVLTTVSSHTRPDRAIVDAGRKALNTEYSMPLVKDIVGAEMVKCTAEHGFIKVDPINSGIKIGDKINLIVGYEDLTVFLHDRLFGVRNGVVEQVWDIQGRGKLS
jgi:D-serine deaminase-like pyridoxal phosphate-dependent protein